MAGPTSDSKRPQTQLSPQGATNVMDSLSFLDHAELRFKDRPDVFNKFIDIMKDFKSQSYVPSWSWDFFASSTRALWGCHSSWFYFSYHSRSHRFLITVTCSHSFCLELILQMQSNAFANSFMDTRICYRDSEPSSRMVIESSARSRTVTNMSLQWSLLLVSFHGFIVPKICSGLIDCCQVLNAFYLFKTLHNLNKM